MKSTYVAADGYVGLAAATSTAQTRRLRVYGVSVFSTGTAGSVILKDGGSGGTSMVQIDTPASATEFLPVMWGGNGILFSTDCYADVTDCKCTVFWS